MFTCTATNLPLLYIEAKPIFVDVDVQTMNVNISDIEKKITMLEAYKSKNIIVYCRSGRRSKMATKLLKKKNFNVTNLEGGFIAWRKYFSTKQ